MSDHTEPGLPAQPTPEKPQHSTHDTRGESQVWAAISSLVAGPAVWGGIGWMADNFFNNTTRVFTPVGVVVGFITSFYIVYIRFGRN